ncbi:MAG: TIGR04283 family arsenosugar biosynthesis glycosyltransferase [Planctomycetota bacterium]
MIAVWRPHPQRRLRGTERCVQKPPHPTPHIANGPISSTITSPVRHKLDMRLSVVIPTLDEQACIARCVESALRLGAIEVVVADGGSVDATRGLAERAGAIVVQAPAGRGGQLNRGAEAAGGDTLLFLHADTRLPPEAADQIASAFHDPATVHGAFRQRIDAAERRYRWLEWGNALRVSRLGVPYGDQALFVRRSAFDDIGGFPDEPLMEDVVIARRLRRLCRPALLDGPLHVSARRWRRRGVVRQTLTNWTLLAAWSLGVPPKKLAAWYDPASPRRCADVANGAGVANGADVERPVPEPAAPSAGCSR